MKLLSTNSSSVQASWKEGVLNGLAPDGGLWLPNELPSIGATRLREFTGASFPDLAIEILSSFLSSEVPPEVLREVCLESFNFPIPLVTLSSRLSILELFHGPTCAFKDFGARFMSRLFRYFYGSDSSQVLTVLTATSGDTGSAVADAFFDASENPAIRVVVLFPKGKISEIQARQMTTLGGNIYALEVDGNFDDCQRLVKEALHDSSFTTEYPLTSANSINIARLLPQSLYYVYAWLLLAPNSHPVFSVPSGNLGNLTGGLLAQHLGMPVTRFIAATNKNEVFPRYLNTGEYLPSSSAQTVANAMDVGAPSNFARISQLYNGDHSIARQNISGYAFDDTEILSEIKVVLERYEYLLDPHTAIGTLALRSFQREYAIHPGAAPGIVLATAHPAKFSSVIERATGTTPTLPTQLQGLLDKPTRVFPLSAKITELERFISEIPQQS